MKPSTHKKITVVLCIVMVGSMLLSFGAMIFGAGA